MSCCESKKKRIMITWSMTSYLMISIVSYAFFYLPGMILGLIVGIILSLYFFVDGAYASTGQNKAWIYLLAALFVTSILSPIAIFKSLPSVYFIVSSCVGVLLAYASLRYPREIFESIRIALISVIALLLLHISVEYPENLFPLEDLLAGAGSSNVVTSFLIVMQVAYSATAYIKYSKFTWVTTLLTLIICFIGFGRGSLLAAILLLILLIALKIKSLHLSYKNIIVVFGFGVVTIFSLFVIEYNFIEIIINNSKLQSGLVDESRLMMIEDYVGAIDGLSPLLFGASYHGTSINNYFDNNPHNSFIRAHHMLGIFYVAFIILSMLVVVVLQSKYSNIMSFLGFCFILNFRAFSEPILYPTPLDIMFYLIVFSYIANTKSSGVDNSYGLFRK